MVLQLISKHMVERDCVDVSKFGYDLDAVKKAVALLKDGDTLFFPNALTTYQMLGEAVTIPVANITVTGNGLIKADYGFRPTASGFTADGLRMEAPAYSQNARAIQVDIPSIGTFLKNFVVRNCSFKNFFYACRFAGGDYNVTGNEAVEGFPVRDVVIENCYSETYSNQNAGHFQVIQVENVSYLNNRTYGGQNATSYNAIKGNGYIKVIGNYDDNNSYGSCEIENASGKVVISNNTFKKKIWVDDSYSAVVDGNYTDDIIHVTVGSNNGNADNVVVSNNVARAIRAESFGTYLGGKIKNLSILGNTLNSPNANTYGIWVHGTYTELALISDNNISGTYTSGNIGIVRGTGCEVILQENVVKGSVVITSTGGLVYGENNLGATYNGTLDYKPLSESSTVLINVKDYGAKGDGTTDDTVSIQNAINQGQNIGADVFFPSGTYMISNTLNFAGVSLRGVQGSVFSTSSKGSRIKCTTKTFTAINQTTLTADKLTFTVENLIVENALTGLFVTYAVNSRFRNLYFTGCDKSIQLGTTGAVGLLFCTFDNIYTQSCRESVNFTANDSNNNNVFINCMFRATDLSFTLDCVGGLGAVNNQFINCEFRADNGQGLLIGKAKNTTLSNCYFECKANSIRFTGASSNTFIINPMMSLLSNTNTQGDTAFMHLTQRVSVRLMGGSTYLNTDATTTGLYQFSSAVATDMNSVKIIDPMRHAGSLSVPFHATSILSLGTVVRASDGFDWHLTVNTSTGAVTGTKLT